MKSEYQPAVECVKKSTKFIGQASFACRAQYSTAENIVL